MTASIILAVISAALAAVLVLAIWTLAPRARRFAPVLFAGLMVGVYGLATVTLGPMVKGGSVRARAERAFNETPAFRLIGEDHPEFKASFVDFVESLERKGVSRDEAYVQGVQWGRQNSTPYLLKYVSRSSDSAVVLFVASFSKVLDTLRVNNPQACAEWLFGAPKNTPPQMFRLSQNHERGVQDALYAVVSSAKESPLPAVDSATGNRLLQELILRIQADYGADAIADLATLADSTTARLDPDRTCRAAYVMYATALRLPSGKAGPLLRFLFSGE